MKPCVSRETLCTNSKQLNSWVHLKMKYMHTALFVFVWLHFIHAEEYRMMLYPAMLFNINRNLKSLFMLTKPANAKADTCKVLQVPAYTLGFSFSNVWLALLIWTDSAFIGILCHLCAELIKWKRDWDKFLMILLNLQFNESWQCLASFSADLLTSSKSDRLCCLQKLRL